MTKNDHQKSVYQVTQRIIKAIEETLDTSETKANLASLRKSMGKEISETADIWSFVFPYMPQEFLSVSGAVTKEEKAILSALQLYAMHQQGNNDSVHLSNEKQNKEEGELVEQGTEKKEEDQFRWKNIGYSLKVLGTSGESESINKRFNAMITSTTFEELTTHLRQLISILKSKSDNKINYARLAQDLLYYQTSQKEMVRLSWGQTYYGLNTDKTKGEKHEEK